MLDLLRDSPIIEIKGDEFVGLEGNEYIEAAYLQTNINKKAIQDLYYHYMGGNEIKKSSILAIPSVYKCGIVIQPWRKGHNKKQDTGVMAAPISINGTKYICCIVTEKNKKIEYPYAIRLFDLKQIEELICNNIVRDGSETTSLSSDKAKSNPLTVAKVLQKYLIAKKNEENNAFAPYRDDLRHMQSYQNGWGSATQAEINWWRNKNIGEGKQQKQSPGVIIRLTESDLHRIVKESISRILCETHMQSLYHFVSVKQLRHIFRHGFTLSDEEESWSINPKLPNTLSFSRNKNSVQGFPYMVSKWGGGSLNNEGNNNIIIRIEIDTEQLKAYGKVRPFDFMYHFDDGISSKEDIVQMARLFPNSEGNTGIFNQPFSQAEERLYSKLKTIPKDKSLLMIKNIDIFYDYDNMNENEYNDFVVFLKWLKNACNNRIKISLYNNINKFNLQYK